MDTALLAAETVIISKANFFLRVLCVKFGLIYDLILVKAYQTFERTIQLIVLIYIKKILVSIGLALSRVPSISAYTKCAVKLFNIELWHL